MIQIHIGCCGFQKAHRVYYENFDLIEIQSTFYKLPMLKTANRWRSEAPKDFVFTLKAWQLITHEPYSLTYRRTKLNISPEEYKKYGSFRPTDEVFMAWERTREIAQALHAPVVVFQCPPQFTPTQVHIQNLREFFNQIERDETKFAWEPRGEWPNDLVQELCAELDLIHCVDAFTSVSVYGSPNYYRMHGSPDYSYKFTDGDLLQLKALCEEKTKVYCLFNNVYMWEDAIRFKTLLNQPVEGVEQPGEVTH